MADRKSRPAGRTFPGRPILGGGDLAIFEKTESPGLAGQARENKAVCLGLSRGPYRFIAVERSLRHGGVAERRKPSGILCDLAVPRKPSGFAWSTNRRACALPLRYQIVPSVAFGLQFR